MDIRAEAHFTLTVVMTDEEAKQIILDPDTFLSELQDAIAPNGDYAKRAAQSDAGRKGHRTIGTKRHCTLCDKDIATHWFDKHMRTKHPTAGGI